ncbi:MAG: D-alanyl-D-alanine carboxypeptidase family protein, partial [Candidatus Theseobacter exili]|nr:D-alanyl-D-alanine carboxypeptidase family protein [Candidatus Theseobacter exili]
AKIPKKVNSPALGSIVVDANTGQIVSENNPDIKCYPASLVKLMMLLIIQEKIEEGSLNLTDTVRVTAEAARMGGSQVYLAENEEFTIEDLLYSLIIQSANDSAVALAIHVTGSKKSFSELMQGKAQEIGMTNTEFHSVHGLPPDLDQKPDISTPRDLAILAMTILKHPEALRYTSTKIKGFRNESFEMRSHNKLLGSFPGCNGLKTGYFRAGGYSIVATAERDGLRYIAVVAGSEDRIIRDAKAKELLSMAFSSHASQNKSSSVSQSQRSSQFIKLAEAPLQEEKDTPSPDKKRKDGGFEKTMKKFFLLIVIIGLASLFYWFGKNQS